MEIRFRPLSAAKLARQVSPGQTPTEDGQSFVDIVESLTAADQTPEKEADAGGSPEQRPLNRSHGAAHEFVEDSTDTPSQKLPETTGDDAHPQAPDHNEPQSIHLGARLDLTA